MPASPISHFSIRKKKRKHPQFRFSLFSLIHRLIFSSFSSTSSPSRAKASKSTGRNTHPSTEEEEFQHDEEEATGAEEEEEENIRRQKGLEEKKRELEEEMVSVEEEETSGGGGGGGGGGGDHQDQVVVVGLLQRSVKQLHFGDSWEEKEAAAAEIGGIARDDRVMRKSLAALGVIPSLVAMLDSGDDHRRGLAIHALIQLAHDSYTNKALMVEAGILTRLPALIHQARIKDSLVLLLSISSLAGRTHFPMGSSEFLPSLVAILDSDSTFDEVKMMCLGILHNLSADMGNTRAMVSSGAVGTLLRLSQERMASARSLGTLGNLVVTMAGKKAMEEDSMVPKRLMEIMAWEEQPRCQELAAYVLMVLAHRSSVLRQKMAELGVVPLLLEVALLGTPLAQKRALKILEWFKDRHAKLGVHSGPQAERGSFYIASAMDQNKTEVCRKAIDGMVKQSLNKNMESIMRRANVTNDTSKRKALAVSSRSKSLNLY